MCRVIVKPWQGGYIARMPSDDALSPSSPAGHGITTSQNVARDVMARIDEMRAATGRSRIGAYAWFLAPIAITVGFAVSDAWPVAIGTGYFGLTVMPVGIGVHIYRRRAMRAAELLDRERDVSWVSRRDGLVFFSDDGLFIEKRGGFKPYGAQQRRYTHVELIGGAWGGGTLRLHGHDRLSGATYSVDVTVPDGWTEADTKRVQEKVGNFELVV